MYLKIFKFLDGKNKFYFYLLLILNILTFFLEFISLASIPIFISSMITPEYLLEEIYKNKYFEISHLIEKKDLFIISSYFVLIAFFFKNVFLIVLTYLQDEYLKKLNKDISKRLFIFYLNGPFEIHLNSNPSTLARNISYEVQGATSYLYQVLMLTRDILALIVIFVLLAVVNFKITLGVIIILTLLLFIYLGKTRPSIKRLANFNQKTRKEINQIIFETFGAIKDIKILKKEDNILDFFYSKISKYEDNYFKFKLISKLPKFILELLAITILIITGLVFSSYLVNLETILPSLSLVAISLIRMIPAFNSFNANYNYLRLYNVSINLIVEELERTNYLEKPKVSNENILLNKKNFIKINNLTFGYNNDQNIFENLNLEISEGEKICIIGPTGSGKSTLFHLILGLLVPKKGSIAYKGRNIFFELKDWYNKIGYISQNLYILDNTIKNNITLNFGNNELVDQKLLTDALSISQLNNKIKEIPSGLETKVGMDGVKLSGGEKQRIAIARAIYRKPKIFLMDEFTSAIDQETEEKIFNEFIKNFPKQTLIIIAHKQSIIDKCDSIWKIQNKGIVKVK